MRQSDRVSVVQSLMLDFADRTGLCGQGRKPKRYLWTDAFAVCNFLEICRQTGTGKFIQLALHLIDEVHVILGRHRNDDARKRWISGLSEAAGRKHPTAGGLRIGKALPEHHAGEPHDERAEWDQNGQYFHYLTKWMHALHRTGQFTGNAKFNRFARKLARTAHARFTYIPPGGGPKRMYWKMSIDLKRALVSSMGDHDPLDSLITYYELGNSSSEDAGPALEVEIDEMNIMCRNRDWTTDDPLGLGDLLDDACRVGQMMSKGVSIAPDLLGNCLSSALQGLDLFLRENTLSLTAGHRLAFREFGLSIGLHASDKLRRVIIEAPASFINNDHVLRLAENILCYGEIAKAIEDFWFTAANQSAETWLEHRDINEVMMATSLAPEAFLNV
jgi:hypothetical protein